LAGLREALPKGIILSRLAKAGCYKQNPCMTGKSQNEKGRKATGTEGCRAKEPHETAEFQMKMKIARQCMERYHNALQKLAE